MTRIINNKSTLSIIEKSQDNIILIDKPVDWSSFDVVKKIKNIGRFNKVGHAGTLDPFANGLLIIGTGRETKNLKNWSDADKIYEGKIEFGKQTNTYDITGEEVARSDIRSVDWEKVNNILNTFVGDGEQIPPMFSAKKVNGVRLYKLARKGKEIDRKAQSITIYSLDLVEHKDKEMIVKMHCSKGTYVRTFANDIGIISGYKAYLKELRRLAIGTFSVKDALSLGQFESYWSTLN